MTATLSFDVRHIADVGWVDEGYARTDSGSYVLGWSGATTSLHLLTDEAFGPLIPNDPNPQVAPVACGDQVAFLSEDPVDPGSKAIRVCRIGAGEVLQPPVPAGRHQAPAVWHDKGSLLLVEPTGRRALLKTALGADGCVDEFVRLSGHVSPRPSVGPDGRVAYVDQVEGGPALHVVGPDGGDGRVILRGKRGAIPVESTWDPAGRYLLVMIRHAEGPRHVLLDLVRGNLIELNLPPLRSLPEWDPAGRRLLLALDTWPHSRVGWYDVEEQAVSVVPLPHELMATEPRGHDHGVTFVGFGPAHPPALWLWRSDESTAVPLTPLVEDLGQPMPEVVRLSSRSGYDLPALVFEPLPGSGPARGTVVMLHGGPAEVWRINWSPLRVALAAAGYRVVLLETRGGSFRGWSLPRVALPELAPAMVADVIAAIDDLVARGLADEGSTVLYGHSHGAYIAYRASLALRSTLAATLLTSGYLAPGDVLDSGDPDVRRFAQLCYGEVTPPHASLETECPLLLIHGEHDPQVPLSAVRASFERLGGRDHQFLVLDGEGHKFRQKTNVIYWIEQALAFLGTHVDHANHA